MIKLESIATVFSLLAISSAAVAQDRAVPDDDFDSPLDQSVPVAAEEPLEAPEAIAKVVTEDQLIEEFTRYRRLINEGILDEADVAAKKIVEMAIKVYGPRSRETASALNNLGIVQHSNGQFDAAIQNFTSAVEIVELAEDDRLNGALVNPLKGLGSAQLSIGRPDQAKKTFTRAAHITHVNEGPHNIGQIEILESIAEILIRVGEPKAARDILDRIHIINVKHFEKDPLGLLPSLMTRASWQHRAGYFADERVTYRRAIRIIESGQGKNSPMLVEPLRRLGESFYFVDLSMATPQQQGMVSTGEMYFKRAVRIAQKAETMDWEVSARSRVSLADYYNYVQAQNRSRKIYRETWDYLSADEERIAERNALFANPVPIQERQLPSFAGRGPGNNAREDDLLTGKVVVAFSVSVRGRVRDMRTEVIPAEFTDIQRMVHREVRSRVFRPRLVEGEVVAAEDLVFEHEFSYLQSELDALRSAQSEADKNSKK